MSVSRPSDRSDAQLLRALGHTPEGIETKPSPFHQARAGDVDIAGGTVDLVHSFRFRCSCGYVCTWRQTPEYAAEAGIHHMRKAAAEYRRNGGVSQTRAHTG